MRRRRPVNPRFSSSSISKISIKNVSVKHSDKFHRNKHKIPEIILGVTEKHEIIHGERAVHKHTPKYLHRHTSDFDIFTNTPLEDASEAEKALDKAFGGDFFYIDQGSHPGTVRVVAHANKESYADYTRPSRKIPFKKIDGNNYVTSDYIINHSKKVVNDPFSGFRHAKDRDTLNRMRIAEGYKKIGGK